MAMPPLINTEHLRLCPRSTIVPELHVNCPKRLILPMTEILTQGSTLSSILKNLIIIIYCIQYRLIMFQVKLLKAQKINISNAIMKKYI